MSSFNLTQEFRAIFADYTDQVARVTEEVLYEVARESASTLRHTSPRKTGKYANNWKVKNEKKRIYTSAVVYNDDPTFRISHLLENGHATRNGGRTAPREHIYPVNEHAQEEAVSRVKKKIEDLSK